jgi:nitrate reductase gamma subunit
MTGIFWPIFVFTALTVFLALMIFRIVSIIRMPVHLRWELAPIPHEKGRAKHGGSYLEDYEWWRKKRSQSLAGPLIYMANEIFLLKGVWKNNRKLWPFSFSLHTGIYLVIITLVLHFINALFIITGVSGSVLDVFQNIAAVIALVGYLLGGIGAIGLILKRALDAGFRNFSTFATYFRLVFLGAVFISGLAVWFSAANFGVEASAFIKGLLTLDKNIAVGTPLAAHIIIFSLFIIYLPFTDMVHFITKFFTYHAVRWNDMPLDGKIEEKVRRLAMHPMGWAAGHITGNGDKNWADLTKEGKGEKEKR